MLSQEKLNSLHKLQQLEVEQILYECIEILGVVDIQEACEALNVQRSRIYQIMNEKNIIIIGKHKYLKLNDL